MKYVAIPQRPKASEDWEDKPPVVQATTVYERESDAEPTGLYDANGAPLYRVHDRVKMGYL